MKTRWIGVAATALAVGAGPAWARSDATGPAGSNAKLPEAKRAAVLTASAWAALAKGNVGQAVQDAEAATLLLPNDAGTRVLLGRSYLAAGRFGSAETAFSDALSLDPALAKAAISRALAQIALGKSDDARASLAIAEGNAPDADIGLAEALLGDGTGALKRLDAAARTPGADARTRQNLGLVYALEGRWVDAAAIAQQDVPADLMPQRIRRWAMIAQMKADPAMQVGAILGVLPAADAGQPTALALTSPPPVQAASVEPVVLAEVSPPAPEPQPNLAAAPAAATFAPIVHDNGGVVTQINLAPPSLAALITAPAAMPMMASPVVEPLFAVVAPEPVPAPLVDDSAKGMAFSGPPRMRAAKPAPARWAEASPAEPKPAKAIKSPPVKLAGRSRPVAPKPVMLASHVTLKPSAARDMGGWAVQLGAFSSVSRTQIAWGKLSGRAAYLSAYQPTGSGRRLGKAMIYRLSVSGLPTRQEAVKLCLRIRSSGGSCFVRNGGGDLPMQWAVRSRADQPA